MPPAGTSTPEISIIVVAFNNADALPDCLSSLKAQTYLRKHIVIVCDRASSDNTEAVVDKFAQDHNGCTEIKSEGIGRSKARNLGWQAVNSPIVMFADGDDVYDPEYVSKGIEALQAKPGLGGVCLGGKALVAKTGILSRYFEAYGSTDDRVHADSPTGPDWAWIYLRECVEATKGFDEELTQAEDKDLCMRVKQAGYGIAYVGGVNWYHRKPPTIRRFVKKECLGGKRRVVYELRRNDYRSILLNLAPIVLVALVLAGIPLWGVFYSLLILALGAAGYGANFLSRRRAGPNSTWDALGFSFLAFSGKLASSAGTVYGLILLGLRKARIISIDFGRF